MVSRSTITVFMGCCFLLAFAACQAQPRRNTAVNQGERGFVMDLSFYSADNNCAKQAVAVKDGIIIAGRKFTRTDSAMKVSALIKISNEGKLIKQELNGDDRGGEKGARIESVLSVAPGKILQVGQKGHRLWLREFDENLKLLRDTVMANISIDVLFRPVIGQTDDGFFVVSNPLGITRISSDWSRIDHHSITQKLPPLLASFDMFGAAYHAQNGLFYFAGGACLQKKEYDCIGYQQMLLVYDPASKKLIDTVHLSGFDNVRDLQLANDTIYIAGHSRKEINEPRLKKFYITVDFDFIVSRYNLQGKELSRFTFSESELEMLYDMEVFDGKIHLAGDVFDTAAIRRNSLYVALDPTGKVLQKRIFGKPYVENRIEKIYRRPDGKVLLLGQAGGWRIVSF